jgi:prolyl-tRNA synthetase
LFQLAVQRRLANTTTGVQDYGQFKEIVEGPGGFVFTGWCGDAECEARVKDETKTTIRLIADGDLASRVPPALCLCGKKSDGEVVRARGY